VYGAGVEKSMRMGEGGVYGAGVEERMSEGGVYGAGVRRGGVRVKVECVEQEWSRG
jgi:hypothetical protein